MSLWRIAWNSIRHRALSSALTAFSMALGVALVVAVLVIHGIIDQTFRRSAQGYDLIVGPKGSSLELVLNTVYHMGKAIGTIPYEYLEELETGRFAPDVEVAVPIATGDNYQGFRIIGTTPDLFDKLRYRDDERYTFREGENIRWAQYDSAVIGSTVADKTGLKVGDTFRPVHGVDAEQGEEHEPFTVVGILDHTGTPNDRALFVNFEGFVRAHEHEEDAIDVLVRKRSEASQEDDADADGNDLEAAHDHEGEDHEAHAGHDHGAEADEPDQEHGDADAHEGDDADAHGHDHDHAHDHDPRRLTAILVVTSEASATTSQALPAWIKEEMDAQAVSPVEEISKLFENIVGNIQIVLVIYAVTVIVVAGIGILVSIYNSMTDRRREIAIMRALGAQRATVMSIILMEAVLLSLGGGLIGEVLGHSAVGILGPWITENTGVMVHPLHFSLSELILIPGLILLASIVGFLPAVVAYRTDVAESLTNSP